MRAGTIEAVGLISAIAALSGCATSSAGLYQTRVERVIESNRDPRSFAGCVAENLIGMAEMRSDGPDHFWLLRSNSFQVPVTRWDFTRTSTGSRAELRSTIPAGSGSDKVQACAGASPP